MDIAKTFTSAINYFSKKQHTNFVMCLIVFDGYLWSGYWNGTIEKWGSSGNCIGAFKGNAGAISCLTVFNGYLWSGSGNATIKKWDSSGNYLATLQGHTYSVN